MNFGLPGAMSAQRLFRHLRENGIVVTLEQAADLRNSWLNTFTEMQKHMNRVPMKSDPYSRYGYNTYDEDDEEEDIGKDKKADKKAGKKLYEVKTITGFIRSRATFNAA